MQLLGNCEKMPIAISQSPREWVTNSRRLRKTILFTVRNLELLQKQLLVNILSVRCFRSKLKFLALSLSTCEMCDVCSAGSGSWVHTVNMELKFSSLNWLSLEPFNVPGHRSPKPVLNTLV